ncbi:hypothetical protein QJQ45_021174 [Haematococcus lacustris]|nr:hypothetical protein QJQ45_021174 [Haematococcus lacustris]
MYASLRAKTGSSGHSVQRLGPTSLPPSLGVGARWHCVQATSDDYQAAGGKQKKKKAHTAHTAPSISSASPEIVSQPPQRHGHYSPLHYNIQDFCSRVVPTENERLYKQQIIEAIRQVAKKALPDYKRMEVQVFGSFASGLNTWSSDVDMVVTGIMRPDKATGGYDVADRGRVTARLRRIGEGLRRCKALESPRITIIPKARIPIIKVRVRSVDVDISLSDDTGVKAAHYLAQQARAYPPMKPLVLVLKSYLVSCGLNDVAQGGLSSYSLCNMVIAHLQEELKSGRDIFDLGETLYAFMLRYGEEFDYGNDAVSVGLGGIVAKKVLGHSLEGARLAVNSPNYDQSVAWYERLCVDCPLTGKLGHRLDGTGPEGHAGRDVSSGTYRIDSVREAWQRGSRKLEALARGRPITDDSINYLTALFDVNRVVKRKGSGSGPAYQDKFIAVVGQGSGNNTRKPAVGQSAGASLDELAEEELGEDGSAMEGLDDDIFGSHDLGLQGLGPQYDQLESHALGSPGRPSHTAWDGDGHVTVGDFVPAGGRGKAGVRSGKAKKGKQGSRDTDDEEVSDTEEDDRPKKGRVAVRGAKSSWQ